MRIIPRCVMTTLTCLCLLAALAVTVPGTAAAQSACFGATPTIIAVPGQPTVGTPGNDVILGTNGPDVIRGRGGADRICSLGGADRVFGGAGRDRIDLGAGDDQGAGGKGSDTIRGSRGRDVLSGGAGPDILVGGGGDDTCRGNAGRDRLSRCGSSPASRTPSGNGRFETLPPGADLPTEAACARRVRPAPEIRSANASYNNRRGTSPHNEFPEVTGNYTGTTEEIIQWAACKHGIDEDLVRAQLVIESWWRQRQIGDLTSNQSRCHPSVRTGSGSCPETLGIGQVKYRFHTGAYEDENAIRSTAYNLDYVYAFWRRCFEGELTWLNNVERGRQYRAGDAMGCLGVWFSGRWYDSGATGYMERVNNTLRDRTWETRVFRNAD